MMKSINATIYMLNRWTSPFEFCLMSLDIPTWFIFLDVSAIHYTHTVDYIHIFYMLAAPSLTSPCQSATAPSLHRIACKSSAFFILAAALARFVHPRKGSKLFPSYFLYVQPKVAVKHRKNDPLFKSSISLLKLLVILPSILLLPCDFVKISARHD